MTSSRWVLSFGKKAYTDGLGDGYSISDDSQATHRKVDGLWSSLRDDFQVRVLSLVRPTELMISRHPDELYINGIQRESFIPAIELIKDKFEVVDLNSPTGNFTLSFRIRHH